MVLEEYRSRRDGSVESSVGVGRTWALLFYSDTGQPRSSSREKDCTRFWSEGKMGGEDINEEEDANDSVNCELILDCCAMGIRVECLNLTRWKDDSQAGCQPEP
jgi:hypothetical protein